MQKFGFTDVRNVLERASARETTSRVAVGALAKVYLRAFGVEIRSHVTRIGSVTAPEGATPGLDDFEGVDESPVRCLTRRRRAAMVAEIDAARKANESLGGVYEVRRLRRWCRGSARTSPGTTAWTAASPWRSCRSRR